MDSNPAHSVAALYRVADIVKTKRSPLTQLYCQDKRSDPAVPYAYLSVHQNGTNSEHASRSTDSNPALMEWTYGEWGPLCCTLSCYGHCQDEWGALPLLHRRVMSDILKTNRVILATSTPLSIGSTKWDKFRACVHGHFVSAPFPSEEADNPDGLS